MRTESNDVSQSLILIDCNVNYIINSSDILSDFVAQRLTLTKQIHRKPSTLTIIFMIQHQICCLKNFIFSSFYH